VAAAAPTLTAQQALRKERPPGVGKLSGALGVPRLRRGHGAGGALGPGGIAEDGGSRGEERGGQRAAPERERINTWVCATGLPHGRN
jgi:hypothetical protein